MSRHEVLIVGAGPTGLTLALWLAQWGVSVRIIDKTAEPGTTSRALAVQARTLELYRPLGLTAAVLERGHKVPAINLWVRGSRAARLPFEQIGSGLTAYPFLLIFPQDQHERLLIECLQQRGIAVDRRTELVSFEEREAGLAARLIRGDGSAEVCEVRYIAGCDGARSRVRESMGSSFPGGTYRQVFYVADVDAQGPAINGELHIDLDEADFLAVFALAGEGRVRLIGTVRGERAERADTLKFEDVSARAIEHLKVDVRRVNWFSTYRVHHRVSHHFRKGRAFLLGDAAHIHSPAGGQGMNTGIGDAANLAWKLAMVLRDRASEDLLDSYESERSAFARRLVATTDRVFTFATAGGPIARLVRTRLVPLVAPAVLGIEAAREFLFRTVGQLALNYRDSPLSSGKAGEVHGGDRMPWVTRDGHDNYEALPPAAWQCQVYGSADDALTRWCHEQGLPLQVFPWEPKLAVARDALYLLRPDGYVGLAEARASVDSLARYASEHRLTLGSRTDAKAER
jgi:2-polyprenyl-6-methoxyphenol hydroxylase-like FAD-dependent oxidoreductase